MSDENQSETDQELNELKKWLLEEIGLEDNEFLKLFVEKWIIDFKHSAEDAISWIEDGYWCPELSSWASGAWEEGEE